MKFYIFLFTCKDGGQRHKPWMGQQEYAEASVAACPFGPHDIEPLMEIEVLPVELKVRKSK